MSNRSWFLASEGKQQGPYPEAQLREFIANGTVAAETLVWTEGMAGWQKAGDISGLLSGASDPPVVAPSGVPLTTGGAPTGQSLSVDFGIWAQFAVLNRQHARDSGALDGDGFLPVVYRAPARCA